MFASSLYNYDDALLWFVKEKNLNVCILVSIDIVYIYLIMYNLL